MARESVSRALRLPILIAVAVLASAAGVRPSAGPALHGCPRNWTADLSGYAPLGQGPLKLASVHCLRQPEGFSTLMPPAVAPDLSAVARLGSSGPLIAQPMSGDEAHSFPVDLGVSAAFGPLPYHRPDSFQWDAASHAIWTAIQDRQRPRGGWALVPMRPVRARADGTLQPLPELRHAAGGLDGLMWVGHRGRALAQFGTRGAYYRPERTDRDPTLAMVDATRGRILDTLRIIEWTGSAAGIRDLYDADAVVLPDGRMRALLRLQGRGWLVWTEGERPGMSPDPFPAERGVSLHLTPDGRRVLLQRRLVTNVRCRREGGCEAGEPVSGEVAGLYELQTGRRIWAITATDSWVSWMPGAVSPDGRLALVGLPREGGKSGFALVSMRDGRVLQVVRTILNEGYALGFSGDGRKAWVNGGLMVVYDVAR